MNHIDRELRIYSIIERIDELLEDRSEIPSSRIFIGNLNPETTARDLENIFYEYSPVHVRARIHGKPCIAFVDFKDIQTASKVISKFDRTHCLGRTMRISYCRPENPRKRQRENSFDDASQFDV